VAARIVAPLPDPPSAEVAEDIRAFVLEGLDLAAAPPEPAAAHPFWSGLAGTGTQLWLDTGAPDEAAAAWSGEFTGLTTNNSLLNAEVQRGACDDFIREAARRFSRLTPNLRGLELSFMLNARHGLRLARRFGGKISVELHTDLANDVERTCVYARRYYEVCPEHFVVKIPFGAAGLLAARQLLDEEVPVSLTLGFSVRQCFLAAAFAHAAYVNVFVGRIGSYLADNGLGDGAGAGEKTVLASQKYVREVSTKYSTRQIAASLRQGSQVVALAGVDVLTIPPKVAAEAATLEVTEWKPQDPGAFAVTLPEGVAAGELRLNRLWEIGPSVRRLIADLNLGLPENAGDLAARARELGVGDLFPQLTNVEMNRIAADGKIPKHATWAERIRSNGAAIDSLLTLAGLAAFDADQRRLDDHVRALLR